MPYIDKKARDVMFDDDDEEFEDYDDLVDLLNAPPVTGAKSAGSTGGSKVQSGRFSKRASSFPSSFVRRNQPPTAYTRPGIHGAQSTPARVH